MIITLTTDFGLADAFVGTMKGVILGIAPEARIVDLSHDVRSYDVLDAAVLIDSAYRYFPNVDALLVEAPLDGATPNPDELFGDGSSEDAVEYRADKDLWREATAAYRTFAVHCPRPRFPIVL